MCEPGLRESVPVRVQNLHRVVVLAQETVRILNAQPHIAFAACVLLTINTAHASAHAQIALVRDEARTNAESQASARFYQHSDTATRAKLRAVVAASRFRCIGCAGVRARSPHRDAQA